MNLLLSSAVHLLYWTPRTMNVSMRKYEKSLMEKVALSIVPTGSAGIGGAGGGVPGPGGGDGRRAAPAGAGAWGGGGTAQLAWPQVAFTARVFWLPGQGSPKASTVPTTLQELSPTHAPAMSERTSGPAAPVGQAGLSVWLALAPHVPSGCP